MKISPPSPPSKLLFVFLFILTPFISTANGGPIDESYLYKTGHIQLKSEARINLVRETLDIDVLGDWCEVKVTYLLESSENSTRNLTYGFPVSVLNAEEFGTGDSISHEQYIEDYNVSMNGDDIPWDTKVDPPKKHNDLSTAYLGWDSYIDIWHISNIEVKPKEKFVITVAYKIKAMYSDWATSKFPLPGFSKRTFRYDLTPAKGWGHGMIDEFLVNIDFTKIMKYEPMLAINNAPSMKIPGNGKIELYEENYNLNDSVVLIFDYDYQRDLEYIEQKKIPNIKIKSISSSSQLGDHKAEHLLDDNPTSAWVEGLDGLGLEETITVVFREPTDINTLGIALGYQKSATLLAANAKPSKLKITIHAGDETSIRDFEIEHYQGRVRLTHPVDRYTWIDLWNPDQVDSVEIEIIDAVKGSKYDDTCISDIIFLDQW